MRAAKLAGALGASVLMTCVFAASGVRAQAIGGPASPTDVSPSRAPLPESMLESLTGGDAGVAIAVSNQRLQAVNSGNSVIADTVTTGSISLDHGALSGFNGLGNVVINTGANNNLQSSISVSIVTPR